MIARYGIFDTATLGDRAKARAVYQTLAGAAGKWTLPPAIRSPMSTWDFVQAETAMTTATQIVGVRDSIQSLVPGFSLDGTAIEQKFESAATQVDLNDLLALVQKEAAAAGKLDQATKLKNGSLSVVQTLGLMGTNLDTALTAARADLQNLKPDNAAAEAQSVIDTINGSSKQGMLRGGAAAGGLVILLLLVVLLLLYSGRKRASASTGPGGGFSYPYPPGGGAAYPMAPGGGSINPPLPGSVPASPYQPGGPVQPPAPRSGSVYPYPPGGFDPNTGAPLWSVPGTPAPSAAAPVAPAPVGWQPPAATPLPPSPTPGPAPDTGTDPKPPTG